MELTSLLFFKECASHTQKIYYQKLDIYKLCHVVDFIHKWTVADYIHECSFCDISIDAYHLLLASITLVCIPNVGVYDSRQLHTRARHLRNLEQLWHPATEDGGAANSWDGSDLDERIDTLFTSLSLSLSLSLSIRGLRLDTASVHIYIYIYKYQGLRPPHLIVNKDR